MGQNRRYAEGVARREQARWHRYRTRDATPRSLTEEQLDLERQPLTKYPQPVRVVAWVDYGDHPVLVRGLAVAATAAAVAVRWPVLDVDGDKVVREDRAWLWQGAVTFADAAPRVDDRDAINVPRGGD